MILLPDSTLLTGHFAHFFVDILSSADVRRLGVRPRIVDTMPGDMRSRAVSVNAVPQRMLPPEVSDAWRRLRSADPAFDSPFFHPGFAEAVDQCGPAVTVVVGRDRSGDIVAIWPMHRHGRVLRPVGWPATDFQGPIGSATLDPRLVLSATHASVLLFDHLIDRQPALSARVQTWRPSPFIDTDGGLEGYLTRASKSGRSNMSQARRRTARATREIGPLRFTSDSTSDALLNQVIALKRQQYRETNARDYFSQSERVDLMRHLLTSRQRSFSGVLSAVHFGETLIAAHFGIRADHVLHWWFPVYAPEFSALSPGWILLRELVAVAPELGITRIDLGRGEDEYKRRAKTGEVAVGEGYVSASRIVETGLTSHRAARDWVRRSELAPRLKRIARTLGR